MLDIELLKRRTFGTHLLSPASFPHHTTVTDERTQTTVSGTPLSVLFSFPLFSSRGMDRCLGSVRARARTSPPSFAAPASPPSFAAPASPPPSAALPHPLAVRAPASTPTAALPSPLSGGNSCRHSWLPQARRSRPTQARRPRGN